MKVLAIISTLDFKFRYGCTPAWWQFFKALYELGNEVIVIPYQGRDIESLWWRTYKNPCEREAAIVTKLKNWAMRIRKQEGGTKSKGVRILAHLFTKPKWERHVLGILEKERDVDGVLMMGVPINQLTGFPTTIKKEFRIPVLCYDGDVPASFPEYGGFARGFNIYLDADLSEFDAFLINSKGGISTLKAMGAKRVYTLHYGVDPDVYSPVEAPQDIAIFFYGSGYEYRKEWIERMLIIPSLQLKELKFALGGRAFDLDLGNVERLGDIPFSAWRYYCARSKINLNITRGTHANLYATSTSRPFELAALGCCIVSNPYKGLEEWFEPGKEVFVVKSEKEAMELYQWLLSEENVRREAGKLARARVLKEHTFKHRANELVNIMRELKG